MCFLTFKESNRFGCVSGRYHLKLNPSHHILTLYVPRRTKSNLIKHVHTKSKFQVQLHFTQLSMYKKFNQNFQIQLIWNNSHKKKKIKNQFSKN